MDLFVKVTKATAGGSGPKRRPTQLRFDPKARPSETTATPKARDLLDSLKDEANPVSHSNQYGRAFHLVGASTGHQQSGNSGRSREHTTSFNVSRHGKLKAQAAPAEKAMFQGVICYINGFSGNDVANLELIRLIQENGGETRYTFSKRSCTHIICDRNLSGKKANDEIAQACKTRTKVVCPKWVLASIAAGRRLPESQFAIIERVNQPVITSTFASSAETPPVLAPSSRAAKHAVNDLAWLATTATASPSVTAMAPPPSAQSG